MGKIIVEKVNHITIIKINRPEKRNAIDHEAADLLYNAFIDFSRDEEQYIAILTGNENFSAGADLTDVNEMSKNVLSKNGPMGFTRLKINKPVIAAISGYCVAGGLEMALFSDIRIADKNSKFGFLERRFGVPLIDGGTYRLPKIIGLGRSLDLILTGKLIDADEAYNIGLINYITENGKSLEKAMEIASKIINYPFKTIINDRSSVYSGLNLDYKDGLMSEANYGKDTLDSGVAIKGASEFIKGKGKHGEL